MVQRLNPPELVPLLPAQQPAIPVHVFWYGVPESCQPISKADFVCIPLQEEMERIMNDKRLSDLISDAKSLRPYGIDKRFVRTEGARVRKEAGVLLIHQSVATMLLAKAASADVTFRTWDWVVENINTGKLQSEVLEKDGRVIIIPASTVAEAPGLSLQTFYDRLRPVLAGRSTVSIFPSKTEHHWELEKIGDIGALDEIAQRQAALGDDRFAYRPRTCFGVGRCKLGGLSADARVVLKRSHSAASEHVKITTVNDRDLLQCYKTDTGELDGRPSPDTEHIWFHQEYIEPLQSLGEFRVFIACDRIPEGARVVSIAHTKPGDNVLAVHALSEHTFEGYESSKTELEEFALFIHHQLLSRQDAQDHFESLRVGVRLDIGMSKDGRWFVNEVTRAFDADQFASYHLPYPHIQIAEAFADAFGRYFTCSKHTK
jgi:hypothetical protein